MFDLHDDGAIPVVRTLPRPVVTHPADHLPARGPRRREGLRREAGIDTDAAAGVLERARGHAEAAAAAEVGKLQTALEWARLHPAQPEHEHPTRGREAALDLAGDGAQPVAEFCLAELATTLAVAPHTGRRLVATAVELADRLPQTWQAVLDGRVPAWRAARIADHTRDLSLDAAGFVDDHVHPLAGSLSGPALEELITETIARFDPDRATAEAAQAADHRGLQIRRSRWRTDGLAEINGLLETPDADDLEAALSQLAHQLLAIHPDLTHAQRLAKAVGYLARGQHIPDTESSTHHGGRTREVVIYAHLPHDSDLVNIERERQVVDPARFADWLDLPHARITIRPVIDLEEEITSPGYTPSPQLQQQVMLRDVTCVFPWCTRPARRCQLDHIQPFGEGGETTSSNLACLCTYHHRLKTHTPWTYTRLDHTSYLWTSPHDHHYLRRPDGTTALGP